jgi:antitoxin (DNA-binding transcriptional repressor) of toxin-antitoxin stability system
VSGSAHVALSLEVKELMRGLRLLTWCFGDPRSLGLEPDRIYVDHGLTGTNRKRPGLREALAACRAGDTLVVTKLDRLDARIVPGTVWRRRSIVLDMAEMVGQRQSLPRNEGDRLPMSPSVDCNAAEHLRVHSIARNDPIAGILLITLSTGIESKPEGPPSDFLVIKNPVIVSEPSCSM